MSDGCPRLKRSNSGHGNIYHKVQNIASTSHSSPERSQHQRIRQVVATQWSMNGDYPKKHKLTQGNVDWYVLARGSRPAFLPTSGGKHQQYSPLGILRGEGRASQGLENICTKYAEASGCMATTLWQRQGRGYCKVPQDALSLPALSCVKCLLDHCRGSIRERFDTNLTQRNTKKHKELRVMERLWVAEVAGRNFMQRLVGPCCMLHSEPPPSKRDRWALASRTLECVWFSTVFSLSCWNLA